MLSQDSSRLFPFSHEGHSFYRAFWVEAPAFMAGVSESDKIQRFSAGGRCPFTINMAHAPQEIRTFFVTS